MTTNYIKLRFYVNSSSLTQTYDFTSMVTSHPRYTYLVPSPSCVHRAQNRTTNPPHNNVTYHTLDRKEIQTDKLQKTKIKLRKRKRVLEILSYLLL